MCCFQFTRLRYTAKVNNGIKFMSMRIFYNLLYCEEERGVNPFCKVEGIELIPWLSIAQGLLARS